MDWVTTDDVGGETDVVHDRPAEEVGAVGALVGWLAWALAPVARDPGLSGATVVASSSVAG